MSGGVRGEVQPLADTSALMGVALSYGVPLAAVLVVLAWWLPHARRPDRSPASGPLCLALGAGAVALVIRLAFPLLDEIAGWRSLPQFLVHVCAMLAVYWLSLFALHASQAPSLSQKLAWRRALLVSALTVLGVAFVAGPVEADLARIAPEASADTWVMNYNGIYSIYIIVAMIDVVYLSTKAAEPSQKWVRRGLRVIGIGAMFGVAYACARLAAAVIYAAGARLPWTTGGPTGPTTVLMLVAAMLIVVGLSLPATVQWWDRRPRAVEGGYRSRFWQWRRRD